MRKSQRLRLRDVARIYRLIGECRDLGGDVEAWYAHLLEGAGRMVGGPVRTGGHIEGWSSGKAKPLMALDLGWAEPRFHNLFQDWMASGDLQADLVYARMCQSPRMRKSRRSLLTHHRQQLIPDREWYAADHLHFHEYRRVTQTDDCLYSLVHLPERNLFQWIVLSRAPGDRPFGEWERRVIHWLHREVVPLVGRQLASAQDPPFCLSPRLRQTLECLLEGDSEKQVALRLGLSRQTVHDYVKLLYRRLGVNSRGELLAWWIRSRHPDAGAP